MSVEVGLRRLAHAEGLPMPRYETPDAAGMDLTAAVPEGQPLTLQPGSRALVPTGLVIALPRGYEGQVRPRSGLALKQGLTVANAPGTVDADYRGELGVILINLGQEPVVITRGMRVAQLVVAPVIQVALREVETFDETARGSGGFGSTGT
ncbi:MAG: dUTP diphosphatase [Chelatococcus sp.]|jgi:dUTP pyrophosphatase|uniref:dUTP diphosphatase n=1 Tax=unclassified Chelatococcus TaxID=2638111 RepID=UPI001BCFD01E|nr:MULTISPECIES: dUTP diphosphatase [unclassified Chelatococcus]CAH1656293.1 dUTP diphosphatase [Hyphomicrobiales bacterium]MBS7740511.1 dUTP diphosphatase [Chelatococcus sp. HY11]MBX3538072.1 dUTP diphosphatase [Chelatococcus sp.]MBX3544705.1 dUTP diphosphatase [Chelatococcus sp.]MCO5078246.1 dUTP diphosphatase [Chelatococcus sp.]